jgi:hypothetical protein
MCAQASRYPLSVSDGQTRVQGGSSTFDGTASFLASSSLSTMSAMQMALSGGNTAAHAGGAFAPPPAPPSVPPFGSAAATAGSFNSDHFAGYPFGADIVRQAMQRVQSIFGSGFGGAPAYVAPQLGRDGSAFLPMSVNPNSGRLATHATTVPLPAGVTPAASMPPDAACPEQSAPGNAAHASAARIGARGNDVCCGDSDVVQNECQGKVSELYHRVPHLSDIAGLEHSLWTCLGGMAMLRPAPDTLHSAQPVPGC